MWWTRGTTHTVGKRAHPYPRTGLKVLTSGNLAVAEDGPVTRPDWRDTRTVARRIFRAEGLGSGSRNQTHSVVGRGELHRWTGAR